MKPWFALWPDKSIGLDISEQCVRVFVLVRIFKTFRILDWGEEDIPEFLPREEGVLHAIQRLFERKDIKFKEVAIHISGSSVRFRSMAFDATQIQPLPQLIREELSLRLPPSIDVDDLMISYQEVPSDTEQIVFVAYCQQEALLPVIDLIKRAGLNPVCIGAGRSDLFIPFLLSDDDVMIDKRVGYVFKGNTQLSFTIVNQGIFEYYDERDGSDLNVEDEYAHKINELDHVYLIDGQTEDENKQDDHSSIDILEKLPFVDSQNMQIPSRFCVAAGLAFKRYLRSINNLNLLPDKIHQEIINKKATKWVQRTVLLAGVAVLLNIMGLNIYDRRLSNNLEQTQDQMLLYQTEIAEFQKQQNEHKQLVRLHQDLEGLIHQRSQYAGILEGLGRSMPRNAWLNEIQTEVPKITHYKELENKIRNPLLISGFAFSEKDVSLLLENLEESDLFNHLHLLETTFIPIEDVQKQIPQIDQPLIRFTILMALKI